MKVFIPLDEATLSIMKASDRLVPYNVGFTVLSQVSDELFVWTDQTVKDQTEEAAHPLPECPAPPPAPR